MIIDTHAHLYYDNIIGDIENILQRAKDNGIEKIIVPAVDIATTEKVIELAEKYEMIYGAAGFHPCDAAKSDITQMDRIARFAEHEKIIGIGETGLDYYWDATTAPIQKEFFKLQIDIAKDTKLPIIIHTRNSTKDAVQIIKENYDENLKCHFHCFNGEADDLDEILKLDNAYISYCGNITYKKYEGTDIIINTPIERMLSETDSPFLAPVPNRGKTNEPSNVIYTIKKLSELKQTAESSLKETLYKNALKLYFN